MEDSAIERQVGGDHYLMPIQVIDFINANKEYFDGYQGWVIGNVLKYLVRHPNKGGEKDLNKAIHLIEMYKEQEYK